MGTAYEEGFALHCRRLVWLRTILTLALVLGAACESSTVAGEDGGVPDGGLPDSGTPDGGVPDSGMPDGGPYDGGIPDGGLDGGPDSGVDAGLTDGGPCPANGNIGQCILESSCSALLGFSSTPGVCMAGALECCSPTPDVADNPTTPSGWQLLPQSDVTTAMTDWAQELVLDPTDYPMFSSAMMNFGSLTVLAVVEWLPPDIQNSAVHRGVVLFEPL
jgi:hypothetical protein